MSSASNFAVGVAIAHVAGIAGLGVYSLAYAVWLVLQAAHRSLVTDPMAIENDVSQSDAATHVQMGLAAELALGMMAAVLFAVVGLVLRVSGQHTFGLAFIALAPCLPFLLAQDYWRWVGFMKAAPGQALANDIVYDIVQAAAFVILVVSKIHSPVVAIAAWGMGAFAGAVYGLWQHAVRPALRGGVARLRLRWGLSKWLVAASTTTWGSTQAYAVLTAAFLGPVGLGGLKAAQSLVNGPNIVLLQAGGSIGLPEASKGLASRGWLGLRRVGRWITVAGVLSVGSIGLIVVLFGRRLLTLFYGPEFGRYANVASLLALTYVIGVSSLGAILCLKTTRQTHLLFWTNGIALVVSVLAVVILVPLFGIIGAAEAAIAGATVSTVGQLFVHFRYSRGEAERLHRALSPVDPEPAAVNRYATAVTHADGRPELTASDVPALEDFIDHLTRGIRAAAEPTASVASSWEVAEPSPAVGSVAGVDLLGADDPEGGALICDIETT